MQYFHEKQSFMCLAVSKTAVCSLPNQKLVSTEKFLLLNIIESDEEYLGD